jgi:hypothetical protein
MERYWITFVMVLDMLRWYAAEEYPRRLADRVYGKPECIKRHTKNVDYGEINGYKVVFVQRHETWKRPRGSRSWGHLAAHVEYR